MGISHGDLADQIRLALASDSSDVVKIDAVRQLIGPEPAVAKPL
jgi:hypothetical protein